MGGGAAAMPGPGRAYLGPAGRGALPRYRYRGTDRSLFYRYLSSPACDWITAQIPVWVAPNLITLCGCVAPPRRPRPPRPCPAPTPALAGVNAPLGPAGGGGGRVGSGRP